MIRSARLLGAVLFLAADVLLSSSCGRAGDSAPETPPPTARISVSQTNPQYFQWHGELIYPIGATETGPDTCGTGNGWLAISSGFDWQPDLETLIAHGGNYARVVPYFPGQPIMPWEQVTGGTFDLERINPKWVQRLQDFLAWTEANDVVVQLEVFDNYSFSRNSAWALNPWNPDMNVNYGTDVISPESERADIAMYKALTENHDEVMSLLQHYVGTLVLASMEHGNVIYSVSNESNAPLEWSEYWADFIHNLAESRGLKVLVGDMPHAAEPTAGVEAIAASPSFDFVDVSSYTSEDQFGDNDVPAIVAGTDKVLTDLWKAGKPMTAGKIYYRAPATLWSKFINGTASVRFHRNCDRGGTNEDDPGVYFEYIQNLRSFIDTLNLAEVDTVDDDLVSDVPDGVHADVLGATDKWYVVHLYRETPGQSGVSLGFSFSLAGSSYRWFDPAKGTWTALQNVSTSDASSSLQTPEFDSTLVLLIELRRS